MNAVGALLGTTARFGGRGRQGQDQRRDPSQDPERDANRLETLLERDAPDAERFRERLASMFGERAGTIVAEDGSIDFESLADLMRSAQTRELQTRLRARFGETAPDLLAEDGTLERRELERLLSGERLAPRNVEGRAGRIDAGSALDLLAASRPPEAADGRTETRPAVERATPGSAVPAPLIELSV